jgi:amino acid transporter
VADFMVRIYGSLGGKVVAVLIVIASFGSVFAVLLGYSRIPYAAAVEGQFFSVFARLHPKGNFPYVSILGLGICSAVACMFSLQSLFTALIVAQTVLQFAGQCVAVILLRRQEREPVDSYRMPLFPLPALIALLGWTYIVVTSGLRYIAFAAGLLALGVAMYMVRARQRGQWPYAEVPA